jgi:hypothetical protein
MRDHIERVRIRSRSDAIEGAREPSERPGRNDRRIP